MNLQGWNEFAENNNNEEKNLDFDPKELFGWVF
jgi:hypothetical protein